METSILISIKKLLGLDVDYHDFDTDIIISINTALMIVNDIGLGVEGFMIEGPNETWEDFLGDDANLHAVKTYVYIRTRLIFDPPSSATVLESYNAQAKELEWRLYARKDNERAEVRND